MNKSNGNGQVYDIDFENDGEFNLRGKLKFKDKSLLEGFVNNDENFSARVEQIGNEILICGVNYDCRPGEGTDLDKVHVYFIKAPGVFRKNISGEYKGVSFFPHTKGNYDLDRLNKLPSKILFSIIETDIDLLKRGNMDVYKTSGKVQLRR